jgi:hypothetical protein
VGPPLQPVEVGLFLGIGCMVPELYAAGGNRSYLGVLGHNRWLVVPEINYLDRWTRCKLKWEEQRRAGGKEIMAAIVAL